MKKITPNILKNWNPCLDGYKRFLEILPEGGTLKECIDALAIDGHDEWGRWLFNECKNRDDFKEQTLGGYRNSGDCNSGNCNSGNRNSGDCNSGNWNSGNRNSGDCNSGDWNSGYWNSGYWNSGNWNSGNWNSGNRNSGNWNSGNRNSGFFNTIIPDEILVFNKPCKREIWENCIKPDFIKFMLNVWISEENMTDQEKIDNPNFYVSGGYLKTKSYKDAFRESWNDASKEDKKLLLRLPNFDSKVFFEISGININEEDL